LLPFKLNSERTMDNLLTQKLDEVRRAMAASVPGAVWLPVGGLLQIQGPPDQLQHRAALLQAAGVPFEQDSPKEINIRLNELAPSTTVYYQQRNFLQNFQDPHLPANDVIIIDWDDGWVVYDASSESVHRSTGALAAPYLISNAVAYLALLPKLKTDVADYFNPTDKELVLYSPQKGIKKIFVPAGIPNLDPTKVLEPGMTALGELVEARSGKDFVKCFKDILAGYVPTEKAKELEQIIGELPALTAAAENNLQVYYKGFSFEKLRNDLLKEKDKYFSSLRDILGKVMNQIVGLPVSLAASVYTSYKADNNVVLILVLVAYLAYAVFTHYLQSLVIQDLNEVASDFSSDFDTIAVNSGLPPDVIGRERGKIERRIADIRGVVTRYRILLWASATVFFFFTIYQIVHNLAVAHPAAAIGVCQRLFFLIF